MKSPQQRLYDIVEQAMCIGCGICQSIAGSDRIELALTSLGHIRPVVIGPIDHSTVDQIYDVCPGIHVEGLPTTLVSRFALTDKIWGPHLTAVRAWASDPQVRNRGSTGGVLTALGIYMLRSKRVEFVLHARPSKSSPILGERHLSFDEADIMIGAGARYAPTAILVDVGELLDWGKPFAIIGKPCDVAALRNYARVDARVNQLVRYWLSPVCGGFRSYLSISEFLLQWGINPNDVTDVQYRGSGCPGLTQFKTNAGSQAFDYLDFWGSNETHWSLPFRCRICPDGIGEAADIAACDTWPGGSPVRDASQTDPGTNAVIVRTDVGLELLDSAVQDGALTVECQIPADELNRYQPHQVNKKYAAKARFLGLRDEARIVPQTDRLRIDELFEECSAEFIETQRSGTRFRIRSGEASEPAPETGAARLL